MSLRLLLRLGQSAAYSNHDVLMLNLRVFGRMFIDVLNERSSLYSALAGRHHPPSLSLAGDVTVSSLFENMRQLVQDACMRTSYQFLTLPRPVMAFSTRSTHVSCGGLMALITWPYPK